MTKKIQNAEDGEFFRLAIGAVRVIKNDKIQPSRAEKPKPYPKNRPLEIEHRLAEDNDYDLDTVSIEDRLSYIGPGLQKNVLAKMRKGQFGLDAQIDLHGLSSAEAKRELLVFLHRAVIDGCRSVLIIHGKGYRSQDNLPILKNNLNLWLRQHQDVLAFCSAKPRDGGAGAVLVLLRLAEKFVKKDEFDRDY
ncbi:MAG: Smr/MutS family protein [Methylococcaceae bacterium]|nr:Smr/MutS family protein [Methylococcaceae bacterium]